jgi:hypothetical protein
MSVAISVSQYVRWQRLPAATSKPSAGKILPAARGKKYVKVGGEKGSK